MSSLDTSPWTGHTFLYRMRSLHPLCRRWKPIFPLVAPTALNALTGMDTRLNVRCPSQLGRVAMSHLPFANRDGDGRRGLASGRKVGNEGAGEIGWHAAEHPPGT